MQIFYEIDSVLYYYDDIDVRIRKKIVLAMLVKTCGMVMLNTQNCKIMFISKRPLQPNG